MSDLGGSVRVSHGLLQGLPPLLAICGGLLGCGSGVGDEIGGQDFVVPDEAVVAGVEALVRVRRLDPVFVVQADILASGAGDPSESSLVPLPVDALVKSGHLSCTKFASAPTFDPAFLPVTWIDIWDAHLLAADSIRITASVTRLVGPEDGVAGFPMGGAGWVVYVVLREGTWHATGVRPGHIDAPYRRCAVPYEQDGTANWSAAAPPNKRLLLAR